MGQLDQLVNKGDAKLFLLQAIGYKGINILRNINISFLQDDNIVFLVKSQVKDSLSEQHYSQNDQIRGNLSQGKKKYRESQCYSDFNRTDFSDINIVFNTSEVENMLIFGNVVFLLQQ